MSNDDLQVLIEQHTAALVRLATAILRNRDDAKDVCQETFIRFVAQKGTVTNPRAWLNRTVVNLSINRRKQCILHKEKNLHLVAVVSSPPTPEQSVVERQRRELLQQAIAGLSEGQRSVFLLRQRLGMSLPEIALELGVTVGTVKKQWSRAVTTLTKSLARPNQKA